MKGKPYLCRICGGATFDIAKWRNVVGSRVAKLEKHLHTYLPGLADKYENKLVSN